MRPNPPGILGSLAIASVLLMGGALSLGAQAQGPAFSVGAASGYQSGFSLQAFGVVENFAQGLLAYAHQTKALCIGEGV